MIYHGRLSRGSVSFERAVGVAALDIGGPLHHFLDCSIEGSSSIDSLEWRKDGAETRFPSSNQEINKPGSTNAIPVRRLNLSPFGQTPIRASELGTYSCHDTKSGVIQSLLLAEGVFACTYL